MSDPRFSQRTAEIISTQEKMFYAIVEKPPPKTRLPASVGDKMTVYLKNLLSINVKSFANNVKVATKLKPYIENTDIPLENVRQLVLVYERIVLLKEEHLLGQIPQFLNSHVGKTDLLRFLRDANIPLRKKENFLNSVLTILNSCKSTVVLSQVLLSRLKSIADGMSDPRLSQRTAEIISTQEKMFYASAEKPPPKTQLPVSVTPDHAAMATYLKNVLGTHQSTFISNMRQAKKIAPYLNSKQDIPLEIVRLLVLIYERIIITRDPRLLRTIPDFLNSKVGKQDLLRYLKEESVPSKKKQKIIEAIVTILEAAKSTALDTDVLISLKTVGVSLMRSQVKNEMDEIISAQEKKKILESSAKSLPQAEKKKETKLKKQEAESPGNKGRLLALDCEMVGVGYTRQALARCSVVDYHGNCVYDEYVKPKEEITDYRTQYSGIEPKHMENALSFEVAQSQIRKIILGKIIVGHTLYHDFKVLKLYWKKYDIRDISTSKRLRQLGGFLGNQRVSLARLTEALLNRTIQQGGHSSLEDAKATMELYKLVENQWS